MGEREREERYRAIKFIAIMAITAMIAMPLIQTIHSEYESTPLESYSYGNEMVRFVGPNAFIGFDGNMFPVSWNVLEANPNYSPGTHANPFAVSTNNSNKSAPLIEETFNNYTTKRIESVWQNSAVMIKWNHHVKIAEIFSFTDNGIDASIVVKNLNITNTFISAFYLGVGVNSTMAVNGFNPSCQNISSGIGIIPSSDWGVSVGNISVNWQSEDSIFHAGILSETSMGDQIVLPFETGVIYHNQSYTIDPLICYHSDIKIISPPGRGGGHSPAPTLTQHNVIFTESGLPSGTKWYVTIEGFTKTSTSNSISFSEYDGSYSYSIGSVGGYTVSPSTGSVYVNGINRYVSVAYARQSYSLKFIESGLSSGTSWSLQLNGNTDSTTSSSMAFTEPDGSYSYSIGSISGYVISPSSGNVNINGGSKTVSITFTDMIGPVSVNVTRPNLDGSCNLQSSIYNNTHIEGKPIEYTSFMLPGEMASINFNIPYFDANKGSGQVNTYTSSKYPTVSPDEISGPPPGNGGSPFRGMLIYTLTSTGSLDFPIYCNQNLNGNGVVSFSWTTQPGAYGGFMIELVNNNSVARSYYRHSFDVYSRLVQDSDTKCIGDSAAYTSIYSSSGVYIGKLVITASGGTTLSAVPYDLNIPFGLTTIFISPDNNVGSNEYTYGVFNYSQCLKYTGTQFGSANNAPTYEPFCSLNQSYSTSDSTMSSMGIFAEESIYDLTDTGLLLSTDPCLMAIGLTMVALGPFVFSGTAQSSGDSQLYWNQHFNQNGIAYGSWDPLNNSGLNQPSHSYIQVGWVERISRYGVDHVPVTIPVFTIVNNGKGNPSYMQFLYMNLYHQPTNSVVDQIYQRTLNYFTYSASETIVPILHSYTCCGRTYPITQNDYVIASLNSNCDYTYNGPSYTGAVSLQLYIPMEG